MFYGVHYHLVNIHIPQLISPATFIGKHHHQLKYIIYVATLDICKFSFCPHSDFRTLESVAIFSSFCNLICSIPSNCLIISYWDEVANWFQDAVVNQHCFFNALLLFYHVFFYYIFCTNACDRLFVPISLCSLVGTDIRIITLKIVCI